MADGKQVVVNENPPEVYQTYNTTEAHSHGYPVHSERLQQQPATIFNIPRRTFWIVVAVVVTIVTATIGGSIGGSLAARSKCTPTSNSSSNSEPSTTLPSPTTATPSQPSSTTSYYTPLPLSQISLLNISCPSSPLDSLLGPPAMRGIYTYDCYADQDIDGQDITGFSAYSLQQCVDACSQYNEFAQNRSCVAVVISGNVSLEYRAGNQVNCWVKKAGTRARVWTGKTLAVLRRVA